MSVDLIRHNRQTVAAGLRRLADAALVAAEVYADDLNACDEGDALRVVRGKQASVEHSLLILEASRAGYAKASRERVA